MNCLFRVTFGKLEPSPTNTAYVIANEDVQAITLAKDSQNIPKFVYRGRLVTSEILCKVSDIIHPIPSEDYLFRITINRSDLSCPNKAYVIADDSARAIMLTRDQLYLVGCPMTAEWLCNVSDIVHQTPAE